MSFAEYEAAVAAGLDLWKWENNEYSRNFKAKVIAWYGLHNLIELHGNDAVTQKAERESRRHR